MTPPRPSLAALLAVLLASCSPGSDSAPPRPTPPAVADDPVPTALVPLLGVWDLAESDPALGPCHLASVGFRSDGQYMARSGDQVVTGRYVASPVVVSGRPGYLVVQRPDAHNGEPNCQNIPADVSVGSAPPDAFFEVVGDEAHVYFSALVDRPAASFVRRTFGQ
ncbi:hypothetical protein RQM47_16200 [Rubrivirga sp. S365]|uniref:hypothetical protein n=1 Tax=Rubrivirga sp. S365 TaxID=3076080 RepID=UPI0028CA4D56|nr:hypothetical protein [Rubrivirga sp. S365]MDT7858191.1 hypothetical protein [Rubrivirga sp. S365]